MLHIKNLHVSLEGKSILQDLDLYLPPGEIHALMGPNGSGKSTLANVLAANPHFKIDKGVIHYQNSDLLSLSAEKRAQKGIFLAFQNPIDIPGVGNGYFMRQAYNAIQKANQKPPIDPSTFLTLVKSKMEKIGLSSTLLNRGVNQGFSGGERKCNEILQMLLLEPQLIILDEIDSGLDIDILKTIASIIQDFRNQNRTFLLITHYPRLFQYIHVDKIHIIQNGTITTSGNASLLRQIEEGGYQSFKHK